MPQCIVCKNSFETLSCEHIIPNVICGKITSYSLICKQCNSTFGKKIDSALDGPYNAIINLFSLKRERGESNPAPASTLTGRSCLIAHGGIPILNDVKINHVTTPDGNVQFQLNAPINLKLIKTEISRYMASNKEMLYAHGINYKKSIPKTIAEITKKISSGNGIVHQEDNSAVKIDLKFGGNDFYKALLKIVFFFAMDRFPAIEINKEKILSELNTEENICDLFYYYFLDKPMFKYFRRSLYHSIGVKSYCSERKLIGYIELFSLSPYFFILDENYCGEDVELCYGYDLLANWEVTPIFNFLPSVNNIKRDFDYKTTSQLRFANCRKKTGDVFSLHSVLAIPDRIKQDIISSMSTAPSSTDALSLLSNIFDDVNSFWIKHIDFISRLPQDGQFKLVHTFVKQVLSLMKKSNNI